jgi:hypothetical protein
MRRFVALATAIFGVCLGFFVVSAPIVLAKPACFCKCAPEYDPVPRWANFTAGNQDCRNDCSQACDGAGNLESSTSTGKLFSNVSCVPGLASDCKSGAYAAYKGVTCQLQFGPASQRSADLAAFPETGGKKPFCVVPITVQNANIECASFSGLGAAATCGAIEGGTDPSSYEKARPQLGGPISAAIKYGGTYTVAQWEALFQPIPSYDTLPATAGVCQRYGLLHGNSMLYEGSGLEDEPSNNQIIPDAPPTNALVCLKRKQNLCGSVDRPYQANSSAPLNANAYSCQKTADVAARYGSSAVISTACWGNRDTLCAGSTDPSVLCCLGGSAGTGQCYTNADCGPGKICGQNGLCTLNVVCDPLNIDRRCRTAAEQEKANPNICTLPVLQSSSANCPVAGQTCCKPANTQVLSSCASDLVVLANGDTRFNDFACLPGSELFSQLDPLTGTVKTFNPDSGLSSAGSSSWSSYDPIGAGPHCLGGTIVKKDSSGRVTGTVPRCGGSSYCCNAKALASPSQAAQQAARRPRGAACGSTDSQNKGFTCMDIDSVVPTDAVALQKFSVTRDQYLMRLAQGSNCQVTPYDANIMYSTKECVANTLCCSPRTNLNLVTACNADIDCPSGTRCELSIHACLDASIVGAAQASPSCYIAASSEMSGAAATFQAIIKANTDSGGAPLTVDQFNCQLIDRGTPGASEKCVPAGCAGYPVPAGEPQGTTSQCCMPGVGRSPGATSQNVTPPPPAPPYSIPLPACIKTGNCTLDDIVATGAGFANFLISISGAAFLAIFVYGGFLYLAAGTSDRAEKGKKMIIQATKGMVLIMAGFVIVNFIQRSIISGGNIEAIDQCGAKSQPNGKTYACKYIAAPSGNAKAITEEATLRGCQRGLCGPTAADNYLCCPQ